MLLTLIGQELSSREGKTGSDNAFNAAIESSGVSEGGESVGVIG